MTQVLFGYMVARHNLWSIKKGAYLIIWRDRDKKGEKGWERERENKKVKNKRQVTQEIIVTLISYHFDRTFIEYNHLLKLRILLLISYGRQCVLFGMWKNLDGKYQSENIERKMAEYNIKSKSV